MDCQPEELQFLGMFGIYREAAKILAGWRRLFAQIGAALVLSISFFFFAHSVISRCLFIAIDRDEAVLDDSPPGSTSESYALNRLASDSASLFLFKGVYLLALLVLALLSTAAVVYSVASIYAGRRDLTFRKVIAVAPRVWLRLMSTFLCAFLILFALHSLAIALFLAIALALVAIDSSVTSPLLATLIPLYVASLIYISVVWHLASVLSVLEDARGLEAMRRSRQLIQGKLLLACVIFLKLNFCFVLVEWGFQFLLVKWSTNGAGFSLLLSLVLLLLLLGLVILFALTVQTVVYFVCKSYHHESIDKTNLADHLEAYAGEYVRLKSQKLQMEQPGV
ncbi:uncharacterized protein LOC121999995 [Zingiber officinale]|uniref:Uncharacterized protein n=1 Tax=Zingiber officinale TaxID=94328 RepID=A0A8J5KNT4_ZINOF|nr:uncharacterized protein LOC121999995 [Zingiber officinale]KAG6491627.1 hypothetical protein ZIOFF_046559 [Zingiber officinale]